ncbi:hypothetical protein HK098_007835, partial [Nowakowskiella sp. JEL0407]
MRTFAVILKNEKAELREIGLSIRGFGVFAGPAKTIASEKELQGLLDLLIRRSNSIHSQGYETYEFGSGSVSSFIQAFADIAKEIDYISEAFVNALELAVSNMILQFPKFSDRVRYMTLRSFINLLYVLYSKGSIFISFWGKAAYETLVLTCTGITVSPDAMDEDSKEPEPLYKEYISFWDNLFTIPLRDAISDAEKQAFYSAVYDVIIKSIMVIPQNLDLNLVEKVDGDENAGGEKIGDGTGGGNGGGVGGGAVAAKVVANSTHSSGDISKLEAKNPKDFAIFVHFVDFCDLFLTRIRTEDFKRWIFIFSQRQISNSTKYPLVSGFYKLCGVSLNVAKKVGFVEGILKRELYGLEHEGTRDELNDTATSIQTNFYILFTKYLKEIKIRMRQFKDELLISCLRLILTVPLEFIGIHDLITPLKDTLRLGLSIPTLAVVALDAFEVWLNELPREIIRGEVGEVVKVMNDYLMMSGEGTRLDALLEDKLTAAAVKLKPTVAGSKPFSIQSLAMSRALPTLVVSRYFSEVEESIIVQMQDVIKRVLHIIAGLGGDCTDLLDSTSLEQKAISWDRNKTLKFVIPFREINTELILDNLLPRVLELAENSPDRKIKVAAGELLHSITLFMIGKSAEFVRDPTLSEIPK